MKSESKIETKKSVNLNSIRKEIQRNQLLLIIVTTILLAFGGAFINVRSSNRYFNENLENISELLKELYGFNRELSEGELCSYMDSVVENLSDVDVVSIVNSSGKRLYHTNHNLIGTQYDGKRPDFSGHEKKIYTEDDIGPSGPQRRTYSPVYDAEGKNSGFIMTIQLKKSIKEVTLRTILLFVVVTVGAILIEIAIARTTGHKIKKEFMDFTEDFEGTRFLVDSMRANNHDFTNKLHVILGLIQIGQYEKAVSYIENISIIQRETISRVMHSIDDPGFAALIIGKIARASECNVKFVLKEGIRCNSAEIDIPSEALVTITGNLIDNALDAMNVSSGINDAKELIFGVFTIPGALLITVQDNGKGIPESIKDKVFENGFSTKGTGRGVGLYHTKQLVESLGGTISFESQEGSGTTFMVNLKNRI